MDVNASNGGGPPDANGAASDAPPPAARLGIRYAALSDVGRVRKDNQDSGFASEHLLVVADGVGGAARGDIASSTAVQALRRLDGPAPSDPLQALAGAIHRVHDRHADPVPQQPELDGTSTTITSALFDGSRLGVAHIGDSRGYLLRDGTLSQLTKDHTFVQTLVDEGKITEEESRVHPHRNLILRAVDGVHETDPDLFYVDLAPGDRILLCSDGASGVLDRDRLADILGTGSADYAVVELIRASLEAGSSDNVTCVVADVVDFAAPSAAGPETGGATGPQPGPGAGGRTGADDGVGAAAGTGGASGPILVGAAAEQARRSGQPSKSFFRGHRGGDTGEIDPVDGPVSSPVGSVGASATATHPVTGATADRDGRAAADDEELRYAPRAPRRGRWLRRAALLLVLVLLILGAGLLAYRWTQTQYYVAADGGEVAIFRGVQADIPGVRLNRVAESTGVTVAALPDDATEQVAASIPADSLAEAHAIVKRLTGLARVCPTPSASPSKQPGASTSARRSPSGTARPRASASAAPTASPAPSPSGTATRAPSPTAAATPTPTSALAPPDCIEATP